MKSYISDALCRHSASLQLRSHSYGYAPSVEPRIVPAQVARNIRFHMASYLPFEKVSANDYNLSVSSYVEAKDNREVTDIKKLNAEIKATVTKIVAAHFSHVKRDYHRFFYHIY